MAIDLEYVMSKKITLVLSILLLAVFAGCYSAPVIPPTGQIYNDTAAPMNIGAKGDMGSKQGTATSTSFFGLVSIGDCSISAAAKAGGITNVKHVDYQFYNVLGYQQFTTVVLGA